MTAFSQVAIESDQLAIASDQVMVSDHVKTTHVSVSTDGIVMVFALSPLTVTVTSGVGSCVVGILR